MASKTAKTVLVIGARKGIGKVTAEYLCQKGFTVIGTSRSPPQSPKAAYKFVQLDITDDASVKVSIEQVWSETGGIDVVVNNAGFSVCGALLSTTVEEMRQQFETNLFGFHRVVREIVPRMIDRGKGLVIHLGSIGGRLAIPYQSLYSASKAALAIYTDALRMELSDTNVKFALVEPGDTRTDFHAGRHFVAGFEKDPKAVRAIEIMHKSEQKGDDPLKVAKTIYKIIKTKNPKPRYTVGFQAKWVSLALRLVPFILVEKFTKDEYKV